MAALTPASKNLLLLGIGLVLLQGCGSCVEDSHPKAEDPAPAPAGSLGSVGTRFSKTSAVESSRPPLYRVDAQAP